MRRGVVIFLFLIVIFSGFISAALVENSTWQQNLTGSNYHNGAVFGDIDNDGDLDLISVGCSSGFSICTVADKSYVFTNNGTSFVENTTWQQNLSEEGGGSIALGDIDNDGDLDLILTGGYASVTRIYTNNGTTFTENSTWQQEVIGENGAASNSVQLGDIDNDGDLDLIFPGMGTPNVVYINNGTSFLNNSVWDQSITTEQKLSSALIDLDNDCDLDLSIVGYDSAKGYINNGTSFVNNVNWGLLNKDESSVVWGDIDNDGDFDVVQNTWGGPWFSINNGTALLSGSSWNDDLTGLAFGSLSFGDYDNNGYLDLASAGQSGGTSYLQVALNNGSYFERTTDAEINLTGEDQSSVIWGDIDNDNDLDLVVIKSQKVYINNITTPNQEPTPPTTFSSSYNNREISLGWLNGSDAETSSGGLYYNLMIGDVSANHTIVSGVYGGGGDATRGGTAFGYFGNMMQRKNITLKVDRLEPSTTYYWYVQTIDTGLKAGNWGAVQSFTTPADIERPSVTLNSPVDNYNSSSYNLVFNVTASDNLNLTNVSLWGDWTGTFQINETNSSGINDTNYIFTKDLTSYGDGTYTWQIQAEDNATNVRNSSVRTFTIDTTSPSVAIVSPGNNANSSDTGLDINYIVSDSGTGLDSCWYSNDTYSVNTSINCGTNITTLTWSEGTHNITIWANDSAGNENSSSINFTIDITNPVVTILNPSNNTNTTDTELDINYSATDTYLDSCWYSNDTYSVNTSINCGTNITTLTWSEGTHNITIWANDSARNEGKNTTLFTIDITPPTVTIVYPENNTNTTNTLININYTVSDSGVGLESCWYSNDTYSVNTSINCGTNITTLNWSDITTHNVTIWANDTLGNEGQDSVSFTVNTTDVTAPVVSLISPANGQSYTSNSQEITFNYNITEKNEISNCSLIIDDSISLTNSSINKSATQSFTQTFTPATRTWNINCTDTNNNVGNSSVRTFTVTAPVSPPGNGGGGNGGGITIITPTPEVKEFDIDFSTETSGTLEAEQGDIKTFSFQGEVKHSITALTITSNSITLLITSDPIIVQIKTGETKQIDINTDGVNDLEIKLISIVNGKAKFSLTKLEGADITAQEEIEEAIEKEALFDVKVSIVNLFEVVRAGREVIAEIEAFNVNNIGQVDVVIDYYITSKDDNQTRLVEGSDTLAVEAVASFVRSLKVPYDTKAGKYLFAVDVKYKDEIMASGSVEFRVIKNYEVIIAVGVIVLIVVGIFFYLWRIKKKEEKDIGNLRRMIRKLKIKRGKKWQK